MSEASPEHEDHAGHDHHHGAGGQVHGATQIQTELAGDCVGQLEQHPLFCGEAVATEKAEAGY